jgi:hypothetical protein
LARARGDWDRFLAHYQRSWIDEMLGDVTGALEHGRRAVELDGKLGARANSMLALSGLGLALGRAGRWEEARPCLEEGHAIAMHLEMAWMMTGLATALLHNGDPERALSVAREGAASCASSGHALLELRFQIELAEVAARCGNEAESGAALTRARDLAARTESMVLVPAIHEAAAILAATLGHAAQQQAELLAAQRLYQEVGATGHAQRLASELAASS